MGAPVDIPIAFFANKAIVTLGRALMTDEMVDELQTVLCAAIEERDADGLVIDVSGVSVLDSYLTRAVRDIALLAKLMGARTAVCGLRPAVAIALVEMGLELPGVHTALDLDSALGWLGIDDRW